MDIEGTTGLRVRRRDKRVWLIVLGMFLAVFLFTFLTGRFRVVEKDVEAASLANFDPGYIISDYQMGNYNSMNEAEIQAFLTSKNSCANRDYNYYLQLSANPNYKWNFKDGHFVCLSEELFGDGEVIGQGETAAKIIWQAAQDYKINPQVLIVLLQKETGLITDPIPNDGDYRKATGYGCPDTAPCSSQYYGFKNQIRKAAALFRTVLDGGWTNYPLGNNYVQYNPNASCGGSVVNIRNLATSALYRYTPYQPNAGALAAGYGTADCGAYGNRNFYLYFEDWFGGIANSVVQIENMQTPRVMTIAQRTLLVNAQELTVTNLWLEPGDNYYFTKRISVLWEGERQLCLQRLEDEGTNNCVLMPRMVELSLKDSMINFKMDREYKIVQWTCEVGLKDLIADCERAHNVERTFNMVGEIVISGKEYLLMDNNSEYMILKARTERVFRRETIGPVLMKLNDVNYKYKIGTEEKIQILTIANNPYIIVAERIPIDGQVFYKTVHDVNKEYDYVIPEEALSKTIFDDFLYPRNMILLDNTSSIDLSTGKTCKDYNKGEIRRYAYKITYDGVEYYQNDSEKNTQCAIRSDALGETGYNFQNANIKNQFVDFLFPRNLRAGEDVYAIDLSDGTTCDEYLGEGDVQRYITKVEIGQQTFYRSEKNTKNNSTCAVLSDVMREI